MSVSMADLAFAADWCANGYEGHPDGSDQDNVDALARVAEWMRAEIRRREVDQVARQLATGSGRPASDPAVREKARQLVEGRARS
jgi:hypothetical protein